MKIGRLLIPPADDDGNRPKRTLRRTAGDAIAEGLWERFDLDPVAQLAGSHMPIRRR